MQTLDFQHHLTVHDFLSLIPPPLKALGRTFCPTHSTNFPQTLHSPGIWLINYSTVTQGRRLPWAAEITEASKGKKSIQYRRNENGFSAKNKKHLPRKATQIRCIFLNDQKANPSHVRPRLTSVEANGKGPPSSQISSP